MQQIILCAVILYYFHHAQSISKPIFFVVRRVFLIFRLVRGIFIGIFPRYEPVKHEGQDEKRADKDDYPYLIHDETSGMFFFILKFIIYQNYIQTHALLQGDVRL